MKDQFKIYLPTLEATKQFAEVLAKQSQPNIFYALMGELGSGKTTFTRFFINYFSKKKIKVLSPTFSLVQYYELSNFKIWHYDLYRIKNDSDVFNLDFDLALNDLILMEWPEKIEKFLPKNRIDINFYEKENNDFFAILRLVGDIKINIDFSENEKSFK